MDDLAGLTWSTASAKQSLPEPGPNPPTFTSKLSSSTLSYPALRATPSPLASGRGTPVTNADGANSVRPAVQSNKSSDLFSGLAGLTSSSEVAKPTLSLREQQERLDAEKRRKEEEARRQLDAHFGSGHFLDSLGQRSTVQRSKTTIPFATAIKSSSPQLQQLKSSTANEDDDDLFAAFNADTKVDNASYFPPSAPPDIGNTIAWNPNNIFGTDANGGFDPHDDPFGLNKLESKMAGKGATPETVPTHVNNDDDVDFLGDLAKPVEQLRKTKAAQYQQSRDELQSVTPQMQNDTDRDDLPHSPRDPFEKAVAQLVDLGFSPVNARRGLTESGAGLNVQAAAGWLLDDAERQAKEKARARAGKSDASQATGERPGRGRDASNSRNQNMPPKNPSPSRPEAELSRAAVAMGTTLLKGANMLWKTGQKKMQQAVADFQQEGDTSQPRWMRAATQQGPARACSQSGGQVTDEALMLESGGRPVPHMTKSPPSEFRQRPPRQDTTSPAVYSSNSAPSHKQEIRPQVAWQDSKTRLSRLAADDGAQAYVSPVRRKKAPQPPVTGHQTASTAVEVDLLNTTALPSRPKNVSRSASVHGPSPQPGLAPTQKPPSRVATPHSAASPRQIPSISPTVLQKSNQCRAEGTEYFKRGDFAAAHESYTRSMASVPPTHPIIILLLTNRALTALKTGEPRQAIADADRALEIIGPSRGVGETVEIEGGVRKEMREFYGKALSRKAEALEQLEKWADAGVVWQLCVEAGVGGPTAIAGKQRCQKALAPKPTTAPARSAAPKPKPKPKTLSAFANLSAESEAVSRLRAANKAAEAADDERFAISDKVDAKIAAWRDGKRDNLRALLGSMDLVLWEGSGWKKVGLHELVIAKKVKIAYMKAIGFCHPDKLPQNATTEMKLIAATVFATLNESWDKFKAENGL